MASLRPGAAPGTSENNPSSSSTISGTRNPSSEVLVDGHSLKIFNFHAQSFGQKPNRRNQKRVFGQKVPKGSKKADFLVLRRFKSPPPFGKSALKRKKSFFEACEAYFACIWPLPGAKPRQGKAKAKAKARPSQGKAKAKPRQSKSQGKQGKARQSQSQGKQAKEPGAKAQAEIAEQAEQGSQARQDERS